VKQIFTKRNGMEHDETKRKQADPALFGEISKWIGELEEREISKI